MRPIELPHFFSRYYEMRGVIDFHIFEDVEAVDEGICLEAISTSIRGLDREKLRAISCRSVDDQTFFGEWYDINTGALIKRGTWRTEDGRTLENPVLTDLDGLRISGGSVGLPDPGSGGQFAYAFLNPPYGLGARPKEVQRVFDSVRRFLLPPDTVHQVFDWSDPRLPEAAEYFRAGMEWWGVFLFVVFVPEHQRLVVISASTTD